MTCYWTILYNRNGGIVGTGYTPSTYTLDGGQKYRVEADRYRGCIFSHWRDTPSRSNTRSFTASGAQTFVGVHAPTAGGGEGLVNVLVTLVALAALSAAAITRRVNGSPAPPDVFIVHTRILPRGPWRPKMAQLQVRGRLRVVIKEASGLVGHEF